VYEAIYFRRWHNGMGYNPFGKYKVASGVYMIFLSAQDGVETKVKKSDDCQISCNNKNNEKYFWLVFLICVFFLKIL
jgi:hypothetical protein